MRLQGERDWLHANSVDWTSGPDGLGYVLVSYNVPSEVVVLGVVTSGRMLGVPSEVVAVRDIGEI